MLFNKGGAIELNYVSFHVLAHFHLFFHFPFSHFLEHREAAYLFILLRRPPISVTYSFILLSSPILITGFHQTGGNYSFIYLFILLRNPMLLLNYLFFSGRLADPHFFVFFILLIFWDIGRLLIYLFFSDDPRFL